MPASRSAHIARIQSKATGHSYQAVLDQLTKSSDYLGLSSSVPTTAQQQLESLFINRLETIRFKPTGETVSWSSFGVKRLQAGPDHLMLFLSQRTDLTFLAVQVMPIINTTVTEGTPEVSGVPGLRATKHPLGTCLYRPGIEAEIILAGIDPQEFERAHQAGFGGPHKEVGCAAIARPHAWTAEEREFVAYYGAVIDDLASMESALLRRICLFNVFKPKSAHTWRSLPGGICVELFFDEFTPHQFDELLAMTTSQYLSPRMELQSKDFNAEESRGRITLSCPGTKQTIEIRTTPW